MTSRTETFSEWISRQPIRAEWMDEFLRTELDGDEDGMVTVRQRVTPFGTFTLGIEVAR